MEIIFYRSLILIFIPFVITGMFTSCSEDNKSKTIQKPQEGIKRDSFEKQNYPEKFEIRLDIRNHDQTLLNEIHLSDEDLEEMLFELLSKYNFQTPILLQVRKETKYETYIHIQELFEVIQRRILNQVALNNYKTNYDELTEEQADLINQVYSLRIVEEVN